MPERRPWSRPQPLDETDPPRRSIDIPGLFRHAQGVFEWIGRGLDTDSLYDLRGWWIRSILTLPMWRNLHGDPRWDAVRDDVGMSVERMEAIEFDITF